MSKKKYNLLLDIEHQDAFKEIVKIKELGEVNFSQAVRYIILDYYNLITKKTDPDVRMNAMSKELSMTLNLVTSLVSKVDAPQMRNNEVLQYHQAEKYVEQSINENKKMKSRKGNSPKANSDVIDSEVEEKLSEKQFDSSEVQSMQEQMEKDKMDEHNEKLRKYLEDL